jgi:magnesium transporter
VDDAADLVEEMPANVVKRILKQADPEMRRSINQILRYPEYSAGSIMTTEYVSLRPSMTVEEAILRIRRQGVDKETIYTCYVTRDRHLLGLVTVKDLLLADDDETKIEDIMITNLISVTTHTDQEEVGRMFSKYNFLALPVVDKENRMVGIVTFDDAMDVIEEEVTEDIELMGGMLPSEKTYLRSSTFELFKNRIPWLMLLMVSATFTGLIITAFEGALAAQVALTAFIPMLMGTGGNSGSQSSVTVIRALSLDELNFSDIWRVIWKELRTALLCGIALAVVCFGKIWLVDKLLMGNESITLMIDLVVCLALLVTVIFAKVVGGTLPLLAKALKLDPAVMASPFITTIVDALSLLVYFLFARALLGV